MRNRLLLVAMALGCYALVRLVDLLVPGPSILVLLCLMTGLMLSHSIWLLSAQTRWRRKLKRDLKKEEGKALRGEGRHSVLAAQRAPEPSSRPWTPAVDIFVAAKNESAVIENCVRNLFALEYPDFSVWVIDDNSSDDTVAIILRLSKEFPGLHLVSRTDGSYPGKSAALNEALPLCSGEVVAVFDADAYVHRDFLRIVLPVLEPETVAAVQAQKRIYEKQTRRFLPNCQASEYALDTYLQVARDLIGGVVELRGNGQLIKRAALIDVGGWNNRAITDDLDLSTRLLVSNWDVRMCPQACVWEEGITSMGSLVRQRRRWAEGSIRRYLDYIFPLNSPTRLSLTERFDTFAYSGIFLVPALMAIETVTRSINMLNAASNEPMDFGFIACAALLVMATCIANFFVSIRYYRSNIPALKALLHSFTVLFYVWILWLPCVLYAINRIMFRSQASKWHRTEHIGELI